MKERSEFSVQRLEFRVRMRSSVFHRHLRNLWMNHFSAGKHFLSTDYTDYAEDNGTSNANR
jgi:hypothetical protein